MESVRKYIEGHRTRRGKRTVESDKSEEREAALDVVALALAADVGPCLRGEAKNTESLLGESFDVREDHLLHRGVELDDSFGRLNGVADGEHTLDGALSEDVLLPRIQDY